MFKRGDYLIGLTGIVALPLACFGVHSNLEWELLLNCMDIL
jgi:hypothetical protein